MPFMSFNVDGTERSCRTKILASSTTDATLSIHHGDSRRILHIRIGRDHLYGSCRTMPGAVAAIHPVCQRDAVLLYPHGMTDLDGRFVCCRDFQDSTSRTDFRTLRAFRAAITSFVGSLRLHQCFQFHRGTEHTVRTDRYAKLAGGTVMRHIVQALCSGRNNRGCTVGNFLVGNDCQPAVHFLFLRLQRGRGSNESRCCQKTTAGVIYLVTSDFLYGILCRPTFRFSCSQPVFDSPMLASVDAIHTSHTTAVIYPMFFTVDTRRLAFARTESAPIALALVNRDAKQ